MGSEWDLDFRPEGNTSFCVFQSSATAPVHLTNQSRELVVLVELAIMVLVNQNLIGKSQLPVVLIILICELDDLFENPFLPLPL